MGCRTRSVGPGKRAPQSTGPHARLSDRVAAAGNTATDSSITPPPQAAEPTRIAVVEDNVDNRLLIDAILGDQYALDEYASGADALAAMATRPPDLVLLDATDWRHLAYHFAGAVVHTVVSGGRVLHTRA